MHSFICRITINFMAKFFPVRLQVTQRFIASTHFSMKNYPNMKQSG